MSHEITAVDAADAAPATDQPSTDLPDLDASHAHAAARAVTTAPTSENDPEHPFVAPSDDADRRTFADLELQPEILQALDDMGYERPMPVQLAVYGPMSTGRDIMVQSRTGSGKTSAFGLPIAQRIDAESLGAQALILAPTRELALQVSREMAQIAVHKGLLVQPVYGGAPIKPQIDALSAGAQIIVGTPGRVLDHLRRGTFKANTIRTLVLDECDEMLSMGFQEDIEKIIEYLPAKTERQTVLFSATIPDEIQRIARRHMNDPEEISLSTGTVSVDEISHYYYVVSGVARTRDLLKVLRAEAPESAIIFCNTREETNTVAKFLQRQGYDAEAISSDLAQRDRERVMKRMRDRNLHFLVATDVAARGIDISDLSHVINYTFPESPEVYVHRTGRTGRAGKTGVALSLVGPRELGSFYYLKLIYKIRPEERDLPSSEEMGVLQEGARYERVAALVSEEPGAEHRALARRIWQSNHGERIVGALVQRLLSQHAAQEAASAAPAIDGRRPREQRSDETRDARHEGRERRPERTRDERGGEERQARREERPHEERGDERGRERRDERTREERGDERRRARGGERRESRAEAPREERAEESRAETPRAERAEAPRENRADARRGGEREARHEGRGAEREARRENRAESPREERNGEREARRDSRAEAPRDERNGEREARRESRAEAPREERSGEREARRDSRAEAPHSERAEAPREERTEEPQEGRSDARREERRRDKDSRREERESRRKERQERRRRGGDDEREIAAASDSDALAEQVLGAPDDPAENVGEPAPEVAVRPARASVATVEPVVAKAWPRDEDLDEEAKEFWETWADEKAVQRQQPRPDESKPRNGSREQPVSRDTAPGAGKGRNGTAASPNTRDAARARTRDDVPARTRDDAPVRTRDAAPPRARDAAPRHNDDEDDAAEGVAGDSARLYVNVGKREGLSASDVRRFLGEGVPEDVASRIGSVALRNTHCYVRVPEDVVDAVIAAAVGKQYEGREIVIERARR